MQVQPSFIRLEGITKVFRSKGIETQALDGIHIDLNKGEYLAICGPSGCGKSTLLSILGLLDLPTSGSYLLNGQFIQNLTNDQAALIRNKQIGFIFQNFNLIGDLDVYRNVELPLTYGNVSKSQRKDRVMDVLERVGMTDRIKHVPSQLSGGQQQRVAVARALVMEPDILLADEPTGNLDSKNGKSIMNLLDDLHADGVSICMVTHDPRYVDFAPAKIDMLDGKIVNDSRK